MTKQVTKTTGEQQAPVAQNPNNLYISVQTFNPEGKDIGFRIVDMYHFGTRNWLQNHHWWAMHNGNCVETNVATPEQIEKYLAAAKTALADKFNHEQVAAAA